MELSQALHRLILHLLALILQGAADGRGGRLALAVLEVRLSYVFLVGVLAEDEQLVELGQLNLAWRMEPDVGLALDAFLRACDAKLALAIGLAADSRSRVRVVAVLLVDGSCRWRSGSCCWACS